MRILSSGDWHFNAGYDADITASVSQIHAYIKRNPVDLVIVTGDLYERASEPDSRNRAAEAIQAISLLSEVIIVRGNHDAPRDLEILSRLQSKNEISVDEVPIIRFRRGNCIITMPWLTKAAWLRNNPQASKDEGDKTVSELALDYIEGEVARNNGIKVILAGHMTIAGARAQNHQQVGADGVSLGQYDLVESGLYAALLGHIHLKQEIAGNPRFFYNGSVAALDYGETPEKFFSVLDTESGTVEWVRLETIHRQDIEAVWTPTGIEIVGGDPGLIEGSRVRINLRVEGGDNRKRAEEDAAVWIKSKGALEYKINPQIINPAIVRAVEISNAKTMREKLEEYWKATGTKEENEVANMMLECLAEIEGELCFQ